MGKGSGGPVFLDPVCSMGLDAAEVRASLPHMGRTYFPIQGPTDSEHAFAVFLSLLEDPERAATPRDMSQALGETITRLEALRAEAGVSAPAYHNFAVTDGRSVAAVRYVSDPTLEPISLYYTVGSKYECVDGIGRVLAGPSNERAVIIASERLAERKSDWVRVPPNHVLTVTPHST